MNIVNCKKFLQLPPYTLFAKYEPSIFGELCVKGDSNEVDFWYTSIADSISEGSSFIETMDEAVTHGVNVPINLGFCVRDGLFDEDQLFAVYNSQDVAAIINLLKKCL